MHERDLVLVGGGHTHALLIRRLAMKPIPGVRVTLISESALTPYSGMLPGLVAGHYSFEETHIDLNRLCRRAGVHFIEGRLIGLDPERKTLTIAHQPPLAYDVVSLDTGSTPNINLPGASEHALGVKPVSHFHQAWQHLLQSTGEQTQATQDWGVVGAGAGGIELVLAMAWRLRHREDIRFHLIHPGERVLKGYPAGVARAAEQALSAASVQVHSQFTVQSVTTDGLISDQGTQLPLDQSVLCTPAAAPEWPALAGLDTANGGFVAVNEHLQSTSHDTVFAAGDVAEMVHAPRPKAGVYAVRQAPTLHHNLRHWFAGTPMEALKLQSQFLSLLSLGDRRATGHRNGIAFTGRWVWRWKDRIDRQFMAALNEFQAPPMDKALSTDSSPMHCAGCGSKLGPDLLQATLSGLPRHANSAIKPALGEAEDAMLWTPTPGTLSVQSVDGFRAFSNDLYRLGQVCVHHALSDLYAMNATPVSAQVWVNLAFNHPRLQQRDFQRLMTGIADALVDNETTLGGGHTTEGEETHVSVTANGEVAPGQQWHKRGAQAGDWLVLTKPLGTGVILAADMVGKAPAAAMAAAWDSMLTGNRTAVTSLQKCSAHAVTDVTGFGLLGHLLEMLSDEISATLNVNSIPALDGALALLADGHESSLTPQLLPLLHQCTEDETITEVQKRLLLDPQTSGGLLAAIPGNGETPPTLDLGTVIGRIEKRPSGGAAVRLRHR